MKKTVTLLKLIRNLLLVLFLVSASAAVFNLVTAEKEKEQINGIVETVHRLPEKEDEDPEVAFINNLSELKKENGDLYGWLMIDAAEVDLPVMINNGRSQYYLRRAFDGSYARRGNLFIDDYCKPESDFVIIHGHDMKDGTMFGQLDCFAKQSVVEDNPTFFYYVNGVRYTYRIVAAFHTRLFDQGEEGFRYYEYSGFKNEAKFTEFMTNVMALSEIKTDVKCEYGDRIMVLSTCSDVFENGRFAVVAKQISFERIN